MRTKKICKDPGSCLKNGRPVVGINDSGGARIQEGVDSLYGYGEIFYRNTIASGYSTISVIMRRLLPGRSIFTCVDRFLCLWKKDLPECLLPDPEVIKSVTGEEVSAEALGGAMAHNQSSGRTHFACDSEDKLFETVRNNAPSPSKIIWKIPGQLKRPMNRIVVESSH